MVWTHTCYLVSEKSQKELIVFKPLAAAALLSLPCFLCGLLALEEKFLSGSTHYSVLSKELKGP